MDDFIIITGAESSGNRLLTSIFNYTKLEEDRVWEHPEALAAYPKRNYVLNRSLPHYAMGAGRRFFNPLALHLKALELGYNSRVLITVRDNNIAALSKTADHNRGNSEAAKKDMSQSEGIINSLLQIPNVHIFSYETFMYLKVSYLKFILKQMNITSSNVVIPELIDGNKKYLKS